MKKIISCILFLGIAFSLYSQAVDYSVVSVPEESGIDFTMITTDNDYVCMPLVQRTRGGLNWYTNKILDVAPEGDRIAFLSMRGDATNIFVKDLLRQGSSIQRTNRRSILDFSFSPDGKFLIFSEASNAANVIYQTDARNGFVCRQITNGNKDYSPVYSTDGTKVFFARQEIKSTSIWSYDIKDNFLSSYTSGMNPCTTEDKNTMVCVRVNGYGNGEIWKVNLATGVEECILSDANRSFTTPSISPDGQWILFTGSTAIPTGKSVYWNTDIFVCRVDGTHFSQLTYHAADDLSPEWSKDGKYVYFISQRGSSNATANIWRMTFQVL